MKININVTCIGLAILWLIIGIYYAINNDGLKMLICLATVHIFVAASLIISALKEKSLQT